MNHNHFDIVTSKKRVVVANNQKNYSLPFYYHLVTYNKVYFSDNDYDHYHDAFEFHYIIEGIHEMKIGPNKYICTPGEFLCISPHESHYSLRTSASKTWRIIIDNDHLKSLGIDFDGLVLPHKIDDSQLTDWMREMLEDAVSEQPHNYIKCYAITLQMIVYLKRNFSRPMFSNEQIRGDKLTMINLAIKYIDNHFPEEISFSKLSEQLGYSSAYFSRTFSSIVGISAVQYLQKTRCSYARKLLQDNCTIAEASERCGFSNPSYFIKTYKKIMGHLPSDDKR